MDWKLYAWVNRGSRRKGVLELLAKSEKPLSTNEIKKSLKIAISQASFTLKELLSKKLVECMNPKDKIGKLFRITKKGKVVLNDKQLRIGAMTIINDLFECPVHRRRRGRGAEHPASAAHELQIQVHGCTPDHGNIVRMIDGMSSILRCTVELTSLAAHQRGLPGSA